MCGGVSPSVARVHACVNTVYFILLSSLADAGIGDSICYSDPKYYLLGEDGEKSSGCIMIIKTNHQRGTYVNLTSSREVI